MEENPKKYCRHCGVETKKFWICDNCYSKWDEQRIVCSVCEKKRTGGKLGLCSDCKNLFVEEALTFLKSKPEYWNLIRNKIKERKPAERKFKCSLGNCKTEFSIVSYGENQVISCPRCGSKMWGS
jgi:DNA-directed RNA polymerase subunit RPC12/RpoP